MSPLLQIPNFAKLADTIIPRTGQFHFEAKTYKEFLKCFPRKLEKIAFKGIFPWVKVRMWGGERILSLGSTSICIGSTQRWLSTAQLSYLDYQKFRDPVSQHKDIFYTDAWYTDDCIVQVQRWSHPTWTMMMLMIPGYWSHHTQLIICNDGVSVL